MNQGSGIGSSGISVDDLFEQAFGGIDFDEFLDNVMRMLLAGEDVSAEGIHTQAVNPLYEQIVSKFRPLLGVLPLLAVTVGKDTAPVFAAVLAYQNAILDNAELQFAAEKYNALTAKAMRKKFDAYVAAGFNETQALSIVLKSPVQESPLKDVLDVAVKAMKTTGRKKGE